MSLKIIAGPCSVDEINRLELLELAKIPEVWGLRVVGLKSVTSPRDFMGIDKTAYFKGGEYPSVKIAKELEKTGKVIAFELMDIVQLDQYKDLKNVMVWNPAINQLGYPVYQTAKVAKERGWYVGLKNPKWHGDAEVQIEKIPLTNGEKNWMGNAKYAEYAGLEKEKIIMIQRGLEMPNKGAYRNPPSHRSSARMKALGYEVWFDPSHSLGQLMRDQILFEAVQAMKIKIDGSYLYSGLLIETGTSQTDSFQHLSLDEFNKLIKALAFRWEEK